MMQESGDGSEVLPSVPADGERSEMTLDPPGRIAIVGAGPLGLEAALYGRFLGYDVVVLERDRIASALRAMPDGPLPMMPNQAFSPLALAALRAQTGAAFTPTDRPLPLTIGQWITEGWEAIAASDLLRGRVRVGCQVIQIQCVDVASDIDRADPDGGQHEPADDDANAEDAEDSDYYIDGQVPPDFCLTLIPSEQLVVEAVILAVGDSPGAIASIEGLDRLLNADYLFRIGGGEEVEQAPSEAFPRGLRQISRLFAQLGGRPGLDLYRPPRL